MKKILLILAMLMFIVGCNNDNSTMVTESPVKIKSELDISQRNGLIASFGDEKVIYIDENKTATIISKSGDILSKTSLTNVEPIKTTYSWQSSIPHNKKDTLYATASFIDDVIYYEYSVHNGNTYIVQPFLQANSIRVLDLPCQSGWISDIDDQNYLFCSGKVKASLAIWKEVINEDGFSTISVTSYALRVIRGMVSRRR